jgi:hypothetical protein
VLFKQMDARAAQTQSAQLDCVPSMATPLHFSWPRSAPLLGK